VHAPEIDLDRRCVVDQNVSSDVRSQVLPPATVKAPVAVPSASAKDAVNEMVLGANRLLPIDACDNPVSFGGRYVNEGGGQHVVISPQLSNDPLWTDKP
jgi:hypothetical protein